MGAVVAFIRLGRPLFLGGGFLLYGLGAGIAALHGHGLDVRRYLLGQACVTAFQLMTHYANDYFDYEADRANLTPTKWSGGSRVLPAGELPRRVALIAAVVLAVIGGVTSLVLAHAEPQILAVLGAIVVLAWTYSAPPLRLCARGLGEVDTAIVVTGLVPWLGFALQAGAPGTSAAGAAGAATVVLAIVPPACLQFAMLLAIEFPDAASDAATGKRTLVVRLGAARAAWLYVAITAAAYLWIPLAVRLGLPLRVAIAAALPAPIAAWRIARIADHRDPAAYERMTLFAVFLLVATTVCELVAVVTLAS